MNVSRGTVNNDVKKLKQTLEKYSCRIIGVPNKGIHFEGEEFHKRLVLLYEVFDFMPLSKTVDRTLLEVVHDVAIHYGLRGMNLRLLYKASLIAAERVENGFHLTGNIPMYKNFELGSEKLNTLIRFLEERAGVAFSREENDFISFPVNTRNSAYLDASDNSENE
jgi:lichenan operon transcriptional antiterminator